MTDQIDRKFLDESENAPIEISADKQFEKFKVEILR
jgi:hypothetical protein